MSDDKVLEIVDSEIENEEKPILEDIVGDFIDDIKRQVDFAASGANDGLKAKGLVDLFHNAYARIDNDAYCDNFASGIAEWAMTYAKGFKPGSHAAEDVNWKHYITPFAYLAVGCGGMLNAVSSVVLGAPTYAGVAGIGLSALLILFGAKKMKQIRDAKKGGSMLEMIADKPYEKWVGDLKRAPPQAIREALETKKEYAYANLDLVPRLSE